MFPEVLDDKLGQGWQVSKTVGDFSSVLTSEKHIYISPRSTLEERTTLIANAILHNKIKDIDFLMVVLKSIRTKHIIKSLGYDFPIKEIDLLKQHESEECKKQTVNELIEELKNPENSLDKIHKIYSKYFSLQYSLEKPYYPPPNFANIRMDGGMQWRSAKELNVERNFRGMPQQLKKMLNSQGVMNPLGEEESYSKPGNMSIVTPSLDKIISKKKFRKKLSSVEEGYLPYRMDRYFLDQKIFGRKKRIYGGSILIDCSGSMGLTPATLAKFIENAPDCIIGGYGGVSNYGHLHILAKNGKMVSKMPQFDAGNIVDYPAIQWLAKQELPRLWICDGYVTGEHDIYSYKMMNQCVKFMVKNNILIATNFKIALEIIKKLGFMFRTNS